MTLVKHFSQYSLWENLGYLFVWFLFAVGIHSCHLLIGLLNVRIYRPSNLMQKRRWLVNYAHLGLGCDTPILEALYHGVGETVLERDQVLLETCYQHLLDRGYSITGVQWPNSADDRLSALFDLGNHQLWFGYARVDERQILQLQDSDQEYIIRLLLPRDGSTLAFLHPIVCRKLQAMTKQE